MPVPLLEREESNADTPFGPFREKSAQRIIYTRKTSNLVSEFNFRHVLYKDYYGVAPERNFIYQASFKGYNLSSPLEFKAGRIMTGNNTLQTVDGVSWFYPWGNRLKTTIDLGSIANIDTNTRGQPSFGEARLHYRFNDNAFLAVKAVKQFDESYGGAMLGYNSEDLRITGEFLGGSGTDTLNLAMQYIDPRRFDLTSDYRLMFNDETDSGQMRHYAGIESGQLYFEAGVGNRFWFNGPKADDMWFYDGSVAWQATNRDNASIGYTTESTLASTSRTLYARVERRISQKTSLSIGVEDTRLEN
ncbi:MAG: hypothetical protein KKB51_06015, partial [Candidatus Riflebacteria bacterium]|nr:hypothetical protein [Candidatus Riflebacteria bacterium]